MAFSIAIRSLTPQSLSHISSQTSNPQFILAAGSTSNTHHPLPSELLSSPITSALSSLISSPNIIDIIINIINMSNQMDTIGNLQSTVNSHTTHHYSYSQLNRESIENKLYYLRDVVTPIEFDEAVDDELARYLSPQKPSKTFCQLFNSLSKKLRRRVDKISIITGSGSA